MQCYCNKLDPARCGAKCYNCGGSGKKWETWPKNIYATCNVCHGTGVNPVGLRNLERKNRPKCAIKNVVTPGISDAYCKSNNG